ncbi:MAG: YggS family pyridoxal phosphate-dependent enzyme [Verrucomicrobiales bacterium]|nr:YggS family pyridoxal phosphate-dependent enzyme [Verrucomicrobiales bacterium]
MVIAFAESPAGPCPWSPPFGSSVLGRPAGLLAVSSRTDPPYSERVDIAANLEKIQNRIHAACERAGRDPSSVELMAVSKNHPPETVAAAAALGLRLFGENKVQEARAKIPLCPGHLRWHLIGHLQSNKAKEAVQWFQMVQGVDSLALARELQKRAEAAARTLPILLEVNVAGESTKFGYRPETLLQELAALNALPRLEIHGLMCMAPYAIQPETVRPVFRRCRELARRCEELLGAPLPTLSMGMSGDFEVAIEEGSTLVRVGTSLFGERSYAARREASLAAPEDP